ncbi:MAG: NUDIX hydrolase [Candidatus Competibacteraceae bacterium]|nr:NUDIX hydrolase [Candidatus Competibacteraceae bacterium]
MKYCNQCGATVTLRTPQGDNLPRFICDSCETIHYQNPRLVVGCIPEWEDGRILLCRRAIEPRLGYWTLPAGFMENQESTAAGAARETLEEANARVEILGIFSLFDLPHINQVHVMYRARLLDLDYSAGAESLEAELFAEEAIPWEELAFQTVRETLLHFIEDRRRGHFDMHRGDIGPSAWQRHAR